jgi:hypothetical protein
LALLFPTQLFLYDQQEKFGDDEAATTGRKFIVGACESICNGTSTRGLYYPLHGPFFIFESNDCMFYIVFTELLAIAKKYLSNCTVRIVFGAWKKGWRHNPVI